MNQIEQTLDSREVAEMVGKRHDHLIRDIKKYIKEMTAPNLGEGIESKIEPSDFFIESTYKDAKNQNRPCYLVTKKGCEFIAHKLTGIKGTEFTAKYINRFHDMEKQIMNPLEGISPELQAVIVVDKRVTQVEQKVDYLENTMNIDHAQKKEIKGLANEVVISCLGGKDAPAYRHKDVDGKMISRCAFSQFWNDFKDYFDINSYENLPRVKIDEARQYINRWQPPTNMQLEIGRINRGGMVK